MDCFPVDKMAENYKTNVFADTFRCPQYTTMNLKELTTQSWLGNFIYARGAKGLKDGSKVPEGSHYFQTKGKRDVVMPKSYAEREYEHERVYEVLARDKDDNPILLKKRVVERVGGTHTCSRTMTIKIYRWSYSASVCLTPLTTSRVATDSGRDAAPGHSWGICVGLAG